MDIPSKTPKNVQTSYFSRVSDLYIVKLDTLQKTALLAGGLRLHFLFLPLVPSGRLYSGDAGLSFNGRSVFSVWRMTARFDESFIKTQLALRSMEWQLSVFVEIEENLSPGPQPLLQLHSLRYTEN